MTCVKVQVLLSDQDRLSVRLSCFLVFTNNLNQSELIQTDATTVTLQELNGRTLGGLWSDLFLTKVYLDHR